MSRLACLLLVLMLLPLGSVAENPTFPNPASGARVDTPDDPDFDCDELDDEPVSDPSGCGGPQDDSSVFKEHTGLFSFGPDGTSGVLYKAHAEDSSLIGMPQISGSSVDLAWKVTLGDPRVIISITDTGINWGDDQLRSKIWLNRFELPMPEAGPNAADTLFDGYDVNGDGAFTVDDYLGDSRVDIDSTDGDLSPGLAGEIDGQDLLLAFSDGIDDDSNGYVDDIVGWDHFEDDNNPSDTTSYSNATLHGSGRAREAAEQTNDGKGEAGVCPKCVVMPMRVWDTFIVPGDNWALATVFAADHGAQVQVTANGLLGNTPTAKAANTYAYDKGMALMHVSSDLNTSNHNYPTNYTESVFVNGCISDQHNLLLSEFGSGGVSASPPDTSITTWFRASNLTQYGAHAHVCWEAITGSEATGHAGGAAGMIVSRGLEMAALTGGPLSSNEIKQLLTKTAEDVLPENTVGSGIPDFAQVGWDEHFGYGRVHLKNALDRIAPGLIPPEALIQDPPWWHLLNPENVSTVPVRGLARADRSSRCTYVLEWAAGIEPANNSFTAVASGDCPADSSAVLGSLPLDTIADAIGSHTRDGSVPAANPGERPNPNAHMFTVRLRVNDLEGNEGEDRKVYLALNDPTAHEGWPRFVDVGGNNSPVLYDLDGDGTLEIIEADAGGKLCVYRHDGKLYSGFNGGECWQLGPAFNHHPGAPGFVSGGIPAPSSGLRTPAIADLNNDFVPDIVLSSFDGRVVVLDATGALHFERSVTLAFSTPDKRDDINHPKRGFVAAPSIADMDLDGIKDIVIPALDGYIYGWRGDSGDALPGFPFEVRETPAPANLAARGELIYPVALTDLNNDGRPEIITGSSDIVAADPQPPNQNTPPPANSGDAAAFFLENSAGQSSRVYAYTVDFDSATVSVLPGWPVSLVGILPDVLPFVGPQNGIAAGDLDSDGVDEIVASITTGDAAVIKADGSVQALPTQGVVNGGTSSESTRILNLFEGVVIGDITGGGELDIARYGITLSGAVNLIAVGQNQPQNHVLQVWDGIATEDYAPNFPTAHDDFGLISSPTIANVDGSPGNELLAGSGLYLLQAYGGSSGAPVAGFPKQTGGWLIAVPTIGDVDGDGFLNLIGSTREGWRFVWDLATEALPGNNEEWWTDYHDEHHTQRYGHDSRPPRRVRDAAYDRDSAVLSFVAAGDDSGVGAASIYRLRTLDRPIVTAADWDAATMLTPVTGGISAGATVRAVLNVADSFGYVGIVAEDEAGNRAAPVTLVVGDLAVPPAPRRGGSAVSGATTAASGAAGQRVSAGQFMFNSSRADAQQISAMTVQIGSAVLDELVLRADGNTIATAVVSGGGEFTVSFDSPLTVAAGQSVAFSFEARLANSQQTAMLVGNAAWAGGESVTLLSLSGLTAMLLLLAGLRRRLLLLAALALWLSACGGGGSSGGSAILTQPATTTSTSANLLLTGISGSAGGSALNYEGLPINLARLTVN